MWILASSILGNADDSGMFMVCNSSVVLNTSWPCGNQQIEMNFKKDINTFTLTLSHLDLISFGMT